MDLLEIETTRRLPREEAAAWLHQLADSLARHNDVEFMRDGLRYRIAAADEIELEVELEVEDDGTKLEIELRW
jgi:amphi-Trp domain-containing protein